MSRAARSLLVFGIYLIGTGMLLFSAPNAFLAMIRQPESTDPWIRVLGVVVGLLGAYYVVAARHELVAFARASVWARITALVAFAALAAMQVAPPILVGFGLVDAAGAFWTWTALRGAVK
jgi:hypothetical protein